MKSRYRPKETVDDKIGGFVINQQSVIHFKLQQFEGPLTVLLQMIEERELDITRVSLSAVADQYIAYIRQQEVTMEHLADFLSVAAQLLLIKSKALLPVLDLSEEEEEEMENLEERLKEYKRFKEAAVVLGEVAAGERQSFSREAFLGEEGVFAPKEYAQNIDPSLLASLFSRLIDEIPDPQKLKEKIIRRVVSLEEKIAHIRDMLLSRARLVFSEVVSPQRDAVHTAVSFLAVLELSRRGGVRTEQTELFGDIYLYGEK